jgi:hypothetical protein
MSSSFLFQVPELVIVAILFMAMILANYLGFYIKQRQFKQQPGSQDGLGSVEGSLLGLLALLLSFTFSMSAAKNDSRRQVIIQEANDIGTVILRCDLYPDSMRQLLRADLQPYVKARIDYYNAGVDTAKISTALKTSDFRSHKIWQHVTQFARGKENTTASLEMIPALNDMMDIVTVREANNNAHVPDSILWLLFLLTLAGNFIVGYSTKGDRINWVIVCGFAIMMVMTIYLIIDLDRPRQGIINMDSTHEKMIALQAQFRE